MQCPGGMSERLFFFFFSFSLKQKPRTKQPGAAEIGTYLTVTCIAQTFAICTTITWLSHRPTSSAEAMHPKASGSSQGIRPDRGA